MSNHGFINKKHYRYSTIMEDGVKTTSVEYQWAALDFVLSEQLNLKCGDVVETTYAIHDFLHPVNDTYTVYYDRFCTCCGDLCNDRSMNDKCNDFPDFTHNCYISFTLDVPKNPQLPEYWVNYPCTSTQSCFVSHCQRMVIYFNLTIYQLFFLETS